jgi:hypothetical protein
VEICTLNAAPRLACIVKGNTPHSVLSSHTINSWFLFTEVELNNSFKLLLR